VAVAEGVTVTEATTPIVGAGDWTSVVARLVTAAGVAVAGRVPIACLVVVIAGVSSTRSYGEQANSAATSIKAKTTMSEALRNPLHPMII
jgi:hypothetical protein